MNLVIPIASNSKFFANESYNYPKHLIEIIGKPMIEHVIQNLTLGNNFKKIIFIVKQDDCDKHHLDNIINLLSPILPEVIKLQTDTQGALCSLLLAIEQINESAPLVISNADQLFDGGVGPLIKQFITSNLDAACITFDSVHPRWSYVRIDENNLVVEAAEKRPISRHAIAGFYMYKHGSDFIKYGIDSIKNGNSINGCYYIAPVFNEFILAKKKVGHIKVSNNSYHTFYSPEKIDEYRNLTARLDQ